MFEILLFPSPLKNQTDQTNGGRRRRETKPNRRGAARVLDPDLLPPGFRFSGLVAARHGAPRAPEPEVFLSSESDLVPASSRDAVAPVEYLSWMAT